MKTTSDITTHQVEAEPLKNLITLIKKHKLHDDPLRTLPQTKWETVTLNLTDTFAGFANGLRRILMEELPVWCLDCKNAVIKTDDEFISGLTDLVYKNINLLPIQQSGNYPKNMFILKTNQTTEIIDVKASDIQAGPVFDIPEDPTYKIPEEIQKYVNPAGTSTASAGIVPDSNITIARLRPGKTIFIDKIETEIGRGYQEYGKFSLLDNIQYQPLNVEPYDIFTGTGKRSVETEYRDFRISFRTCGNILGKSVIKLLCDHVDKNLNHFSDIISHLDWSKKYYSDDLIEMTYDSYYTLKFRDQYFTFVNMITEAAYLLDVTVPLCNAGVERYDTRIGVIKVKHANPKDFLLSGIKLCRDQINIIRKIT